MGERGRERVRFGIHWRLVGRMSRGGKEGVLRIVGTGDAGPCVHGGKSEEHNGRRRVRCRRSVGRRRETRYGEKREGETEGVVM